MIFFLNNNIKVLIKNIKDLIKLLTKLTLI